jgi:hypothetical protein
MLKVLTIRTNHKLYNQTLEAVARLPNEMHGFWPIEEGNLVNFGHSHS